MSLYHFTCADHGDPGIRATGLIRPSWNPYLGARLLWLTDLTEPHREGLGRTSSLLTCDRTAVRYEVADNDWAIWWPTWANQHRVQRALRDDLERFGLPAHWWVSKVPLVASGRQIVGAAA